LSGSLALYCAASTKHDDCLIANDNPGLWFLVTLLLVRNDLIHSLCDNCYQKGHTFKHVIPRHMPFKQDLK